MWKLANIGQTFATTVFEQSSAVHYRSPCKPENVSPVAARQGRGQLLAK